VLNGATKAIIVIFIMTIIIIIIIIIIVITTFFFLLHSCAPDDLSCIPLQPSLNHGGQNKTWRRKVAIAHDSSFDKKSFSGARGSSHKCLLALLCSAVCFPPAKLMK